MNWNRSYSWLLAASSALYVLLLLLPFFPGVPMALPSDGICYLIPNPWLNGILIALSIGLVGATAIVGRSRTDAFFPMCFLPLSFAGFWFPGIVPLEWSANLLFFFPLVILAMVLYRWQPLDGDIRERMSLARLAGGLTICLTLIYTLSGWYVSSRIGEHAVDEGHYLIQATSLHEDGDLDIKNNFGFDVEDAITHAVNRREFNPEDEAQIRSEETWKLRAYLHVSRKSQGDRWYSWHPYGISLLIAPTMGIGLPARQLVLGLIAALGSAIAFLLCMELGRSRSWSFMLVTLFSFSIFWFVFAIRSLPEALGATLFAGAMYAAFIASRKPVRAIILLVICCAFMPLAHPRFLPCVGLAGLYFVIRAFFLDPLPKKARIIFAMMLLLGAAGAGLFLILHRAAYASLTAYPLTGLFWAYPEGAWLLLFSERGLIFSFPAAVGLMIGTIYALLTDRGNRIYYVIALVSFVILLLSLGTTDCWDGGPTMYGRYLVVGSLLLIPGMIYLYERTSAFGRWWLLFLGLYSAAYTVVCMVKLSSVGATMLRIPLQGIREYVPILRGLFIPYTLSDIKIGHPYHGWEAFTVNPFPFWLLIATAIIVWPTRSSRRAMIRTGATLALLLWGGIVMHIRHGDSSSRWSPEKVEATLASQPFEHARLVWEQSGDRRLLPHSNRFASFTPRSLTLSEAGETGHRQTYKQRELEPNDWDGRDYRWFTLEKPFRAGKEGPRLVHLEGRIEGAPVVFMTIKEGSHVLYEQQLMIEPDSAFTHTISLRTGENRGDIYLLFRLEGDEGTVHFDRVIWTPVPKAADTIPANKNV